VRRRARRGREARRARLALLAAIVGIGAALIAYGVSPSVRHAVGHAEHSVNHTVSNFFDHDRRGAEDRHRAAPKTRRVSTRQLRSEAARAKAYRSGSKPAASGGTPAYYRRALPPLHSVRQLMSQPSGGE
jgi:hypothetical protein